MKHKKRNGPPDRVRRWQPTRGERDGARAVQLRPLGREALLVALACTTTVTLTSLIFQPLAWWPLAFVCLTPWAVATCRTDRAWLAHWMSFLGGWVFFLINLSWLMPVTGLGYAALAFYLAIYWTMAAWALRVGRRRGISPIWTLPIVWVACEYLRAFVMSGFPWLFVAHSFAGVPAFIQVSDITGAYGVTFIAVMVNGVLTELCLWRWRTPGERPRRVQFVVGTLACVGLVGGNIAYGQIRLGQTDQLREGPTVAVVQEDFPLVSTPPYGAPPSVIFSSYLALGAAAAETQPDLLVFPETVWAATQNKTFVMGDKPSIEDRETYAEWSLGRYCHTVTQAFARGDYASANQALLAFGTSVTLPRLPDGPGNPITLIVGSKSIDLFPEQVYPRMRRYNSALVYNADGEQRDQRYDKRHLVPFGEAVPFRGGSFHWLYRLLNNLSPFSEGTGFDYSLSPGKQFTVFDLATSSGTYRFGTPICYEDVMPYIPRQYVWHDGKRHVDFLVNISNDGWFLHSAELPQHLAICVFRAVENRVGIVRSVNTGISGFIDPNGRTYSLVTDDTGRVCGPGIRGFRNDHVIIDSRPSFYGQHGDWLPRICLVLAAILWLEGIVARWVLAARLHIAHWMEKRRARSN
ncbi:MAG: apolipoprotein N-acyltransferase [Phycisphaerae bacterium]|nr:apolipoprotein N-acyltransferase [Phycisphaerae bacterium]